ncbi:MAG: CCA tRNA nucleotidyltransferase [Ruminococcus sp.]|nr:CCA tRNA nucleotidyltransferase [Ruminococcus sp.]
MINDIKALEVLDMIEKSGHEAYFAGGCVRDSIAGRDFHDIDITTDALPEEIIKIFDKFTTIPTGIKHGTVTVIYKSVPFEITTYRIDGKYSDSRRPDSVEFTRNLADDLSRRDFTVNAMAMDSEGNIVDIFGGAEDIQNKIIRCVGSPEKRFEEDALRIMRAIRFSAQLGFEIEEKTAEALHRMKNRLENISKERIREELDKILCGKNCVDVLMKYSDIITAVIPEFNDCIGFEQHSPYHKYTVWEHIVRAVSLAPPDNLNLRRALFFHDIAKPKCATFDENGRGHFKHHAEKGAEMARDIMKKLRYDRNSISYTYTTVKHHSDKIFTKSDVKRLMAETGDNIFFEVMKMKKCDNSAKNDFVLDENRLFDELMEEGRKIIENNECRKLKDLEINGNDLAELGLHGVDIGITLNKILGLVIEEKLLNKHDILLKYIKTEVLKK